jgi:adenylyl-sulfate kinase
MSGLGEKRDVPGYILWFTGLSGAGKSTLSSAIAPLLRDRDRKVEVLDGDEVRTHLSAGLTFSKEDRDINVRRIGYVARLLARNGVVVITAAISPYREIRDEVRSDVEKAGMIFIEIFVDCEIATLADRDVKGLYKKALAGEIKHFTGVSDPYEPPLNPEIAVNSHTQTKEQSLQVIIDYLRSKDLLGADNRSL